MQRRQYLVLAGGVSAGFLAGCSAIDGEDDQGSKVRESSSGRVEFVSHRLAMIGTTPWAGSNQSTQTADISGTLAGTVKNVSDEPLASVRITAWFYTSEGADEPVGNQDTVVEDLAPDEERDFFVTIVNREETADIDDYELAAEVEE